MKKDLNKGLFLLGLNVYLQGKNVNMYLALQKEGLLPIVKGRQVQLLIKESLMEKIDFCLESRRKFEFSRGISFLAASPLFYFCSRISDCSIIKGAKRNMARKNGE
ncbi:hypothetical protein ACFFHH_09415 [Cytobacillus solani]|uniref:hypothetical protein n=1 Tax=Cytobacillus solani TaxID=1637975 RepID=UPI000A9548D9|nr:hypothetical protein [Cytobacillus solani]USK53743.1 hypothetical protein LIS82_19335 [Cytobacillus solani]